MARVNQAAGCDQARKSAPRAPHRGFTLIELVVVVAIIAILATGLLPLAELANQRFKEQPRRSGLGKPQQPQVSQITSHRSRRAS